MWSQISLEWIELLKIGIASDHPQSLPRWVKQFGELRSINEQFPLTHFNSPKVDIARSAYASSSEFRPRAFATREISTP